MKRFSKNISSILLVALVAITLVGCSSTAKTEAAPEIVVSAPAPAPVVEPAPAPAPEPAPAPAPAPAPEPAVIISGDLDYAGFKASFAMGPTEAVAEFPVAITIEDISAALAPEAAAALSGAVSVEDGKAVFTYPELSKEARYTILAAVEASIKDCIDDYLAEQAAAKAAAEAAEAAAKAAEIAKADAARAAKVAAIKAEESAAKVLEEAKAAALAKAAAEAAAKAEAEAAAKAAAPVVAAAPEAVVIPSWDKAVPAVEEKVIAIEMPAFTVASAPVAEVVEPAPAPAPAPAPVVAAEPVVEEAPVEVLPYGVTEIVKNAQGDASFDLFIVHTNDAHARVEEGTDGSMGYAKLASLVKLGREITDNILVLDAGDVTHGTNIANMFEGETIVDILDMIGYDAVAPGNHDFNYGTDSLLAKAADAEAKILAANVVDAEGNMIFQPYQIYDFNGFDVAVLGLATPDTKEKAHPKYTEGIYFMDFMNDEELALAQSAIDMAREYADFVIVLGHIGAVADGSSGLISDYLCENLKGIDLFVDGHSHTVYTEGKKVGDTLIVSAGQYLNNVGLVEIHVENGAASITGAMLIPAADVINPAESALAAAYGITSIADDAEISAYVAEKTAELDAIYSVVVATIPEDLDGERASVRTKKTNLTKLITAAMTEAGQADFTITNGGGVRASLAKGDVTLGEINSVLPFTNTLMVCEITPAEVYAALEHGYSMLPEQNGAYAQTDLQVVYSKYAEPGNRIKRVLLNGELLDKNDTTTVYRVATNDFVGAGGDGYTMFGREVMVGPMLNEVFAEYLAELYPPQN